jgi:hypothetical protein
MHPCSGTAGPPGAPKLALGQAADDPEPFLVDVEQDELVDRQPVCARGEPLHELGGVGAPAPHHGDLHTHVARIVHSAAWNR